MNPTFVSLVATEASPRVSRALCVRVNGRNVLFHSGPLAGEQERLDRSLVSQGLDPTSVDAVVLLGSKQLPTGGTRWLCPHAVYLSGREALQTEQARRLLDAQVRFYSWGSDKLIAEILTDEGIVVFGGGLLPGLFSLNSHPNSTTDRELQALFRLRRQALERVVEEGAFLFFPDDPDCAAAQIGKDGSGGFRACDRVDLIEGRFPGTGSIWPPEFLRVPDDDWVRQPVPEALPDALNFSGMWSANLDFTAGDLASCLKRGDTLVDFSSGAGDLWENLRPRLASLLLKVVMVDPSPAYLRLALEKFQGDPRVAFRQLQPLGEEGRFQYLDEAIDFMADVIVCTNSVHLYPNVPETFEGWRRRLKEGGHLFLQSGDIQNPEMPPDHWLLHGLIPEIDRRAREIVRSEEKFAAYRGALDDTRRIKEYESYQGQVIPPARPLSVYTDALQSAGFKVRAIRGRTIKGEVWQFFKFLLLYQHAILGWVGGVQALGDPPLNRQALRDRMELIVLALRAIFGDKKTFNVFWTYIDCEG